MRAAAGQRAAVQEGRAAAARISYPFSRQEMRHCGARCVGAARHWLFIVTCIRAGRSRSADGLAAATAAAVAVCWSGTAAAVQHQYLASVLTTSGQPGWPRLRRAPSKCSQLLAASGPLASQLENRS